MNAETRLVACVASVSARLSARSLFWPRENGGEQKKNDKKCLERPENLTETLATQAAHLDLAELVPRSPQFY